MSEINHSQSTPPFLTVLVLLLVAAVGIQTWYMLEMKQKLDTIQSDPSSSQSENLDIAEASSKPGTENTVDYSENGAALKQSKQATQKTRTDKTNLTTDNPASPVPPSSGPPDLADENFFNTPPYEQTWNPHEEIRRMQRYMNRAYYDRYNNPDYNRPNFRYSFRQNLSAPEMDMRENQNQYIVLVNIPGADQKDVSVKLEGQRLTVMGKQEYKNQDRDANGNIIFSERRSGKFKRSITLRAPVEKKGMQTQIDNGVLRILIAKKKHPG